MPAHGEEQAASDMPSDSLLPDPGEAEAALVLGLCVWASNCQANLVMHVRWGRLSTLVQQRRIPGEKTINLGYHHSNLGFDFFGLFRA